MPASEPVADGVIGVIFSLMSSACCLVYVVPIALAVALLVLWTIVVIDVIQRDASQFPNALAGRPGTDERLLWILIVVLGSTVGAVVYYFAVMKPRPRRQTGGTHDAR